MLTAGTTGIRSSRHTSNPYPNARSTSRDLRCSKSTRPSPGQTASTLTASAAAKQACAPTAAGDRSVEINSRLRMGNIYLVIW